MRQDVRCGSKPGKRWNESGGSLVKNAPGQLTQPAFDVAEDCSKLGRTGPMCSYGHAYDWTVVDADMRLE